MGAQDGDAAHGDPRDDALAAHLEALRRQLRALRVFYERMGRGEADAAEEGARLREFEAFFRVHEAAVRAELRRGAGLVRGPDLP